MIGWGVAAGAVLLVGTIALHVAGNVSRGKKLEDWEARLGPPEGGASATRGFGKATRKSYETGFELFRVRAHRLEGRAAGAAVEAVVDGRAVASAPVRNGEVRLEVDSSTGGDLPAVRAGTPILLRHGDVILLEGRFEAD